MTIPVGTAAALDEAAAEHEQIALHDCAASYARMLVLLKLARERLGPAGYDQLAQQIDAVLHGTPEPEAGLVWERLPSGEFAWLRAESVAA